MQLNAWLLALLAPIMAASCADTSTTNTLPKLRLGNVPWPAWAALDVGIEKGFFAAEGVDVEIVQYGVGGDPTFIEEIASGAIDGGFYIQGALLNNALERGQPITYLGEVDWSYGGDQIVVRPPLLASIDAIRKKERTVGAYSTTSTTLLLLDLYFRDTTRHSWSFSVSDVNVTERLSEDLVTNFAAGTDPVSLNFDPVVKAQVEAGGEVVATSATYPGIISEGLMVASSVYDRTDKSLYTKVFKGWIRAVEYMYGREHKLNALSLARGDEVLDIMQRRTFLADGTSKEQVQAYLDNVRLFNRSKIEAVNFDPRDDVKLVDYPTKGVQPLRSHLRELTDFIRSRNPGAGDPAERVRIDLGPLRKALDELKP